jgi:hypothetical protein
LAQELLDEAGLGKGGSSPTASTIRPASPPSFRSSNAELELIGAVVAAEFPESRALAGGDGFDSRPTNMGEDEPAHF